MGNRHCLNRHRALSFFVSLSDKGEFDRTKREAEVGKTVQEMAGEYCSKSERQLFFSEIS
jgi:hypothetical protein